MKAKSLVLTLIEKREVGVGGGGGGGGGGGMKMAEVLPLKVYLLSL